MRARAIAPLLFSSGLGCFRAAGRHSRFKSDAASVDTIDTVVINRPFVFRASSGQRHFATCGWVAHHQTSAAAAGEQRMRFIDHRVSVTAALLCCVLGCATVKQSDTSRTGVEQLLLSSAVDRALNKVDLRPIGGAKVYVETKYLDCVDKNYVIVAMHQRVMQVGATLCDKPEDSDVVLEIASGSVGTDRQDVFVGTPEIPMPQLSVMIPRVSIFNRNKAMGTAKLSIVAYDTKSHIPVINGPYVLARADAKVWNVMGGGPHHSGSVHQELVAATGESDNLVDLPTRQRPQMAIAGRPVGPGYPFGPR